jgi:hypothetical protein
MNAEFERNVHEAHTLTDFLQRRFASGGSELEIARDSVFVLREIGIRLEKALSIHFDPQIDELLQVIAGELVSGARFIRGREIEQAAAEASRSTKH